MEQFQFPFQKILKAQLPENIQQLIHAAAVAATEAYAPYSKFKVGAALLMSDGSITTGSNQENASFPAGICAERSALSKINMNAPQKLRAIAIEYLSDDEFGQPLSPCGLCRQSILEVQQYQQKPVAVYMSGPNGEVIFVEDAGYLLPFSFGKDYLGG